MILSATIVGSLVMAAPANAADVAFADPALQACANQWLGQAPTAPVSTTQAASLTGMSCTSANISNLGGLESFTNLTNLALNYNQITDLTPVSALTKLTDLDFSNNQVSDLSPLASMTGLVAIAGRSNQISDLGPLSSLTNVTWLSLYDNSIVDLAPLASLSKLAVLAIPNNEVSDLTPLSGLAELSQLYADENDISDLAPLAGLPKLYSLGLANNNISDLSGLTGVPLLNNVDVEGNHITDLSPLGLIADQYQNLFQVYARFQTITLPDVIVGQSFANPLLDPHGVTVTGVSSNTFDPNFVLAADGASWSYTAAATNELYILQAYPGPNKPAWQLTGVITQKSLPAPVATTLVDDTATTTAVTAVTIDVLANDGLPGEPALDPSTLTLLDADGNPATIVTVTGGTFEVVDGEIVFTPTAGFTGVLADVDYQVTNADGVTGQASISVTVTSTVIPTTGPTTTPTTGTPSNGTMTSGTPSSSTGSLASTGLEGMPIVGLGALAAAAGVILFAAARRRRA